MKLLIKKILLLTVSATATPTLMAQAPKATTTPAPPHSVFVMPASTRDGRDPFFPESSRPYEDAIANTKRTLDSNAFTIKGMSFERGRAMVIINNHTFAVGDEGDVLTLNGRVHIRVVEIREDTVTIEVNGSRRDLRVGAK